MIQHADLPLTGECPPCPETQATGLRAHMAAIGRAFLGDDQQLSARLAGLSHTALVTLITDLADRIPRGARVRHARSALLARRVWQVPRTARRRGRDLAGRIARVF